MQSKIKEIPEGVEQAGNIYFNLPDFHHFIELRIDGNIFIRGNLIENDKELVEAFREFLENA